MLKRLTLLILSALFLASCAEKTIQMTDPGNMPGYAAEVPKHWQYVSSKKLSRISPGFAKVVSGKLFTFDGAYTNASTAEARVPLVCFLRLETTQLSSSEIAIANESLASTFTEQPGVTVIKKSYNEKTKRFYTSLNHTIDGVALFKLVTIQYTNNGLISAFGVTANGDPTGRQAVTTILESITPSPEIAYK